MKIFYAVQATGNGHISRAMEILPYLQRYGKVDIFLSGSNHSLTLNGPVKYRSKGVSLVYNSKGSLDYLKTAGNVQLRRVWKEVKDLPVEQYDLVINDFECITSLACAYKKVPSINFGHQASFRSDKTPRPASKNPMGEWILKNYAKASQYVGLHFQQYDDFILTPIIKDEIWHAQPQQRGYITVYLPSFGDEQLLKTFNALTEHRFEIFSFGVKQRTQHGNVTLVPVDKHAFNTSLINCNGIITGAGFETPAEALHLQKKLMVIPIKGQYEQLCNAAALQPLGIPVVHQLDKNFAATFNTWMASNNQTAVMYTKPAKAIVQTVMESCLHTEMDWYLTYPPVPASLAS
jgi:uncharacterized protein (TIGR00661 family)